MTDPERFALEADRDRWKAIAYYLADCQAATAAYVGSLKSSPRSERVRQAQVCTRARYLLLGDNFTFYLRTDPESVIRRLHLAATECDPKSTS